MKIRHDVPFGMVMKGDEEEGVPAIMVKADVSDECGCRIVVGMKMEPDIVERATKLGNAMRTGEPYDEKELEALHAESLAIVFCPCDDLDHKLVMNETLVAFHDSLAEPREEDAIDVAAEFWENARGVHSGT